MKYWQLLFSVLVFFLSCSKEKETSKIVYPSTLSFSVNFNDSLSNYKINGDLSSNKDSGSILNKLDLTPNGYGPDYLGLRAQDNNGTYFYFYVKAPTLEQTTYSTILTERVNGLALGSLFVYPFLPKGLTTTSQPYGLFNAGDNFTLQITELKEGLASGTFFGNLSAIKYENGGAIQTRLRLVIKDGMFSKVKIKN